MRNASDKKDVEKIKTHILCAITFFKNRVVYEIMWKNNSEQSRPHMSIRRMRNACWIPKAADTPSEYEIRIAFPL
jgi:hypothetical protein